MLNHNCAAVAEGLFCVTQFRHSSVFQVIGVTSGEGACRRASDRLFVFLFNVLEMGTGIECVN